MSTRLQPYTLSFPQGYDEQAEFEAPFRGYLPGVIVELEDGACATGSRSSTWSVWNRAWRTMQVRAIRTTPIRGLSWFQKSPPKRFNWPCRVYGTRSTSICVSPNELTTGPA